MNHYAGGNLFSHGPSLWKLSHLGYTVTFYTSGQADLYLKMSTICDTVYPFQFYISFMFIKLRSVSFGLVERVKIKWRYQILGNYLAHNSSSWASLNGI